MLELFVLITASLVNILLISTVLASNQKTAVHGYFSVFTATFTLWTIANYLSLHPIFLPQLLLIRLVLFCGALLSTSLLLFVLVFPNNQQRNRKVTVLVVLGGMFAAVSSLTPWVFSGLQYGLPVPGPAIPAFGIFAVGYIILSSLILLVKSFRGNDTAKRAQSRLGAAALITVFVLIIIVNIVLPSFLGIKNLLFLAPVFGVILSLSFTYGILRYHLFDLRVFAARALAYVLSLVTIIVIFSIIAFGVAAQLLSSDRVSLGQQVVYVLLAALLAIAFGPIKTFFNSVTEAFFFRNQYDPQTALNELGGIVTNSVDAKAIADSTATVLNEVLKSECITIVIVDGLGGISLKRHTGSPSKDLSGAIELMSSQSKRLVIGDLGGDKVLAAGLLRKGVAAAATLQTDKKTIGYLFMGAKVSGQPYSSRDRDFIAVVIDELAVAMQNALRFSEIQSFNQTLQHKIEGATKELKQSNQKLHELDEAKDEFISMASHQLRTPLTSIKGYLSMVLEGDAGKLNTMQRKLLEEAFASSERMVYLIGDFLNVSRLQTGKFILERRPMDLARLVLEEVEHLRAAADPRKLTLKYESPENFPLLELDTNKIRQVIMNFIDNSIFYSPEGSTITISLVSKNKQIVFQVKDAGIGVPKAEQHKLFTKFYRASNAKKVRPDGTGIGLFMAKKVIVAHGGSLIFESREGVGSTFGFILPS